MAKYSDIYRAAELQDAYTKLQAWQGKTRAQKKTEYASVAKPANQRARAERITGYILPFQSDDADLYLEARILAPAQTGIGSATANMLEGVLNNRNLKELAAGGTTKSVKAPRGFKFAKVIASERSETATTESASRITGIPYKRHRYNNVVSPFGRLNATESFAEAVKAIKAVAAFETFAAVVGNRIGFVQES